MSNSIVFITGKDLEYPPDRDGGVVFFEAYIGFLTERYKKHIHYLTTIGYSGGADVEQKKEFQLKKGNIDESIDGYTLHRVFVDPDLEYAQATDKFGRRMALAKAEAKSYERFIKDKNEEIERIHIFHVSHAMGLTGAQFMKKTILHPMMTGIGYRNYTAVPQDYIEQEKKVFERVGIIQVPSKDEGNCLTEYYGVNPKKIILHPRGFNEQIFTPKERTLPKVGEGPVNIICANMIRSQKGQKYFIGFAEQCRKYNISVKIQLIGVNSNSYDEAYRGYYLELKKEIIENNLEEYFIFYDVMSPKRLNEYMLSSHISIIPSKYETFGKSALESSATGIPTIVFDDVEPFKDFIIPNVNGITVTRDGESKALFNAFLYLVKNPHFYKLISNSGIRVGRKYYWNALFEKMENDILSKLTTLGL